MPAHRHHRMGLPAAGRRLSVISHHLTSEHENTKEEEETVDVNVVGEPLSPVVRGRILHFFDQLSDTRRDSDDGYDVADHLPGPIVDVGPGKRYPDLKALLLELQHAGNEGWNHTLWPKFQDRYAGGQRTANIVQPVVSFARNNTRPPIIANQVVVSHPADAMRIARSHVQKMPDQTLFLNNGVLSQLDNQRWREQRGHLSEAFLPLSSLQHVLPVSEGRAKQANARLREMCSSAGSGGAVVQLNEFLLNETMAQLMLAMFGIPAEVVEAQNKPLREAFAFLLEATGGTGAGAAEVIDPEQLGANADRVFAFIQEFLPIAAQSKGVQEAHRDGDVTSIRGPLSARIFDVSPELEEKIYNAATFIFAGHDTTANTMSWLVFEVCQRPDVQRKLHEEAEVFFASTTGSGGGIAMADLHRLPYMSRCLAETLRLWPVVPNGTFRQLQHDDTVVGPEGRDVVVKKGTFVQIPNWMRHRSPELWGEDVLEFDPDRDFRGNELWDGAAFAGYNPQVLQLQTNL
jgi:cytochrome P450